MRHKSALPLPTTITNSNPMDYSPPFFPPNDEYDVSWSNTYLFSQDFVPVYTTLGLDESPDIIDANPFRLGPDPTSGYAANTSEYLNTDSLPFERLGLGAAIINSDLQLSCRFSPDLQANSHNGSPIMTPLQSSPNAFTLGFPPESWDDYSEYHVAQGTSPSASTSPNIASSKASPQRKKKGKSKRCGKSEVKRAMCPIPGCGITMVASQIRRHIDSRQHDARIRACPACRKNISRQDAVLRHLRKSCPLR